MLLSYPICHSANKEIVDTGFHHWYFKSQRILYTDGDGSIKSMLPPLRIHPCQNAFFWPITC